jgi:hypothetical protein
MASHTAQSPIGKVEIMKFSIFLVAVLLSGCATNMQQVDREIGAGQPPAYKDGYMGGCNSGYVAAGHPYYKFNKDVARYGSDNIYKQGWDDGFVVCKGKYDAIGQSLRR